MTVDPTADQGRDPQTPAGQAGDQGGSGHPGGTGGGRDVPTPGGLAGAGKESGHPGRAGGGTTETLLQARGVTKVFGGLTAVREVDLEIRHGEIRGLIGPNGAGKTTFFNCITGVYKPDGGDVLIGDKRLNGLKPHRITRAGIARTFQQIRLFAEMTSAENVEVGLDAKHRAGAVSAILRLPRHRHENEEGSREAMRLLRFVGIERYANEASRNLSYGDQRRLEIARALGTKPKLLLLDEPAAGMNPKEKEGLMALIRKIRDSGVTILLIEHDMKVVMGVCEQVAVLDHGEKIAEGPPEQLQKDPRVIEAYLGRGAAEDAAGA